MKYWTEIKIAFDEQNAILKPSESGDCIVLRCEELDKKTHFDLYLSASEAKYLAERLVKYVEGFEKQ